MIVHPREWRTIGKKISIHKIESTIIKILKDLNCDAISFSGGIDSTLLAYFSKEAGIEPRLFTIGKSREHPDVHYSKLAANHLEITNHYIYTPTEPKIIDEAREKDFPGDTAVRLFYQRLKNSEVDRIIAGDGIDEFMCGYYGHMVEDTESAYRAYLSKLYTNHLKPLDRNSGEVEVVLPYLNSRLVSLLAQIPLHQKVNLTDRKLLMRQMAVRARIPEYIINRRKYGFCDALTIKANDTEVR